MWLAATLPAVALLVVFRRPEVFLRPRFVIEDGAVFFKDAIERGPAALLLPYADYLHLVPRAAAWAVSLLPVRDAPTAYAWLSLAILLGVCAFLFRRRLDAPFPPLLALAVAAAPNAVQLFGNLAHVQWFLALLLPLLAVQRSPESRAGAIADLALLVAIGLTGPFAILATPLFLVRWAADRHCHSRRMLLAALACAAGQAAVLLSRRGSYADMGDGPAYWTRVLGLRLGGELLLGQRLATAAPTALLVAATAGLTAGLAWLVRGVPARRGFAGAMAGFAVGALLAMYAKSVVRVMVPHLFSACERYFLIPHVAAMWIAIAALEALPPRRAVAALFLATAGALSTTAAGFRVTDGPPIPWEGLARRIEAGERVQVPVPRPWEFEVRKPDR